MAVMLFFVLAIHPSSKRTEDEYGSQFSLPPSTPKDHETEPSIVFRDATLESGIDFRHLQGGEKLTAISEVMGSGACTADYDNDGYLDIYAVNGSGYTHHYGKKWWWGTEPVNRLYRNHMDGTFVDVTEKAGVGDKGWGMGCAFGDYDNDGDPDLYVTNYGANVLYKNNGDGTFSDVTDAAGVGDKGWGMSTAWGDYDLDGDLDLYVANYLIFDKTMRPGEPNSAFKVSTPFLMDSKLFDSEANVLYRNNGDGTFSDVTAAARVGNSPGKSLGVIFLDYNRDGFPDIYIANDNSRNVLYRNDGNGVFTDVGGGLGVDSPLNGMGVDAGDYDNDGDLDIFSTHPQSDTNILYRNMSASPISGEYAFEKFKDVTVDTGLGEEAGVGYFGWGTGFADFNNDGYLDIFVANGHGMVDFDNPQSTIGQSNQVFQNRGDGTFADVSKTAGKALQRVNTTRGAALGDYDNDGDVDLFLLNNNDDAELIMNETRTGHHWLNVDLRGVKSNRDGIGATITVTTHNLRRTREARSGSGYLSQSDSRVHFGLGECKKADVLEVRWPSGRIQRFHDVEGDQFVVIREGDDNIQWRRFNDSRKVTQENVADGIPVDGQAITNKKVDKTYLIRAISAMARLEDARATEKLRTFLSHEDREIRREAVKSLGSAREEKGLFPLLIQWQRESDEDVRREIVSALKNYDSDRIIPPLIEGLESRSVSIRREATESLAFILDRERTIFRSTMLKKRRAVPPLIMALSDEDAKVREAAVKGLGYSESYRAIEPVIQTLNDPDEAVRGAAAVSAGFLKDKRALGALLQMVRNHDEADWVRGKAAVAVSILTGDFVLKPLLSIYAETEEAEYRFRALSAMVSLLRDSDAVYGNDAKKDADLSLRESFHDSDPRIRREIVRIVGLARLGHYGDLLSLALRDKVGEVRREAAIAARLLGDVKAKKGLMKLIHDSEFTVREEAVSALAGLAEADDVSLFKQIVHGSEEVTNVRLAALRALMAMANKEAISVIKKYFHKGESDFRKGCLDILGMSRDKEGMEFLLGFLRNAEDKSEMELAITALGGFIRQGPVFLELRNLLKNRKVDEGIRLRVLSIFIQARGIKISPLLINLFKDRDDELRFDALAAVVLHGENSDREAILSQFFDEMKEAGS